MTTKRTHAMMVLPVDIICHGTTKRNIFRAGCNRNKPTLRHNHSEQILNGNSSLSCHNTILAIKLENSSTLLHRYECAAGIQAYITVGPSFAIGKDR